MFCMRQRRLSGMRSIMGRMKSYILKVELEQDEDGRWNAVVPALDACYTWGNTREEALEHIQGAARCCIEDLLDTRSRSRRRSSRPTK